MDLPLSPAAPMVLHKLDNKMSSEGFREMSFWPFSMSCLLSFSIASWAFGTRAAVMDMYSFCGRTLGNGAAGAGALSLPGRYLWSLPHGSEPGPEAASCD
jgi:hypothetical protein